MVPRDMVQATAAGAVGRRHVQGPVMNKKREKKAPKKAHKSEREKRNRGTQNDLFTELGAMLDRQNNGKACVLGDTTRILKDLVSQVESLRKENVTLKNESHYVVLERNELRDDNSILRNEILELQNELRVRLQSNPICSQGTTRPAPTVSYPTGRAFPVQQHLAHLPVITTMTLPLQQPVITEQCYAAPPRELQLFPEAASASTEDSELSQDQGISNNVTRPQARYPTPMAMLPANQFPIPSTTGDEQQCSSGTSEEDRRRSV
ncbi:transcription factor BHLH062 isoform X2 [Brachypodium distachyon]|uniref:Iron-related transcription factor 3 bHLH domain-containing protein n=1 Tax=Brachypodium distachyon TaxID=15368 RepID=A0A2K2DK94_BRADI|nr:transcription factor BHLH062 isoform X2 [Brachypodium distachyon]PNT74702.1 hypothetical protein BRADI_1g20560v3 [Brachypodium distachyon]|eukprot:XP_024312637.1 transcription factor BHLH062 isoform X2 [Brachypodium distachyon]